MRPETKIIRAIRWRRIVDEQLASGLSQRAWCEANNISRNSFKNWKSKVINYTLEGGQFYLTIYRLNGVDARMYLQYLLEKMSAHKNEEHSSEFLDTMMPWSDEFREYEAATKKEAMVLLEDFFRKPEKPRTPRKKNHPPEGSPPDSSPDRQKLPLAV